MQELFLAHPWDAVRDMLSSEGISYAVEETRSPRSFFPVNEAEPYVIRMRQCGGTCEVTLVPAPARSASVAAYEKKISAERA